MSDQEKLNVLITGGDVISRRLVAGALERELGTVGFSDVTSNTDPQSMYDAIAASMPHHKATPVVIEQFDLTTREDWPKASETVSALMETMFEADVAPEPPKRTDAEIQESRLKQIRLENELFGKLYAEGGDAVVLDAANDILRKAGQQQRVVSFTTTDGATYGPVEA